MPNRVMGIMEVRTFEKMLNDRSLSEVYKTSDLFSFNGGEKITKGKFMSIEFKNDEVIIQYGLEIKTDGKNEKIITKSLTEFSTFYFELSAIKDDSKDEEYNYLKL